ncbi:hypothetical protein Aglo03_14240 [Actinokineospora globicatena]|uniref:Uncharacterized protein n=1 Tax=Actinokineospora globicatena TaxID=103729 RepID=A0A9W6QHL9_9PSEU|nr:hypothetical protein Aglo03_14240 [Actinokineospora globicatena]
MVSLAVTPSDDGDHVIVGVDLRGVLSEIISTAETLNTMLNKHESPVQDGSGEPVPVVS